ncbi:MAG: IS66 family transposase [Thermoanaerobaculia bacterium]|nr:IS66 family transposase [Thermoanaerobaculia bacterium]
MDLSRQDLANWMIAVGRRIEPMMRLLREEIRSGPVVNIDETKVQVLDEPGRANTSTSYMWVFVGGPPGTKLVAYYYHPRRTKQVPFEYLEGYEGFLQTDGYEGYAELGRQPGVQHVGCWAHVRRKFFEAAKIAKRQGAGSAEVALSRIATLYAVEKTLRSQATLSEEEFAHARREKLIPHLADFHVWLRERSLQVPPSLPLGEAVNYALGEWEKLLRYLESPALTPDNNVCENAIRPFVLGRKNWLFSGCPSGAHASAALYSLIETAKAASVDPYLYLRFLFSNLPLSNESSDFRPYLPHAVSKADLIDFSRVRLI